MDSSLRACSPRASPPGAALTFCDLGIKLHQDACHGVLKHTAEQKESQNGGIGSHVKRSLGSGGRAAESSWPGKCTSCQTRVPRLGLHVTHWKPHPPAFPQGGTVWLSVCVTSEEGSALNRKQHRGAAQLSSRHTLRACSQRASPPGSFRTSSATCVTWVLSHSIGEEQHSPSWEEK